MSLISKSLPPDESLAFFRVSPTMIILDFSALPCDHYVQDFVNEKPINLYRGERVQKELHISHSLHFMMISAFMHMGVLKSYFRRAIYYL